MFTKLLKYEFKSVGKWYFAMNVAVLAISVLFGLTAAKKFANPEPDAVYFTVSGANGLFIAFLFLALGILISATWVATLFIIINRFSKNIFGREGYLTMTLPVSAHQLILSKLLMSFAWIVFNSFVLVIGIFLIVLPITGPREIVSQLLLLIQEIPLSEWGLYLIWLILAILSSTLMIYLAIAIGQLFSDKRKLMGFLAYFLIFIIVELINQVFIENIPATFSSFLTYYIVCYLIQIIIYYWGICYILQKKINIQ
ncbi:ABC transporter permease [Streptococcus sp. H49]|uniref:ABC transporter permease n=1 Tax=Streptococcus huangxiaojuni TaxID=3237239 RepID=UPI0034A357FF